VAAYSFGQWNLCGNFLRIGAFADQNRHWGRAVVPALMMIDEFMKQPRKKPASLDEARLRQQAIGVKLRQMFDEVVNEEVPNEFLDILRRADERRSGDN
jgi:hypothetical protein